jgi:hypothetical protein
MVMHSRWLLLEHFAPWQEAAVTRRLRALTLAAQDELVAWISDRHLQASLLEVVQHWRYVSAVMQNLWSILPKIRAQRLLRASFDAVAAGQFRKTQTWPDGRWNLQKDRLSPAFEAWKIFAAKVQAVQAFADKRWKCVLLTVLTEWYRFSAAICGEIVLRNAKRIELFCIFLSDIFVGHARLGDCVPKISSSTNAAQQDALVFGA